MGEKSRYADVLDIGVVDDLFTLEAHEVHGHLTHFDFHTELSGHAWVGVRAMPPKGGNPDLKLVEFARGVAWMANHAGADWKDPDVAMMRKILKETDGRLDVAIRDAQAMKKEIRRLSATKR